MTCSFAANSGDRWRACLRNRAQMTVPTFPRGGSVHVKPEFQHSRSMSTLFVAEGRGQMLALYGTYCFFPMFLFCRFSLPLGGRQRSILKVSRLMSRCTGWVPNFVIFPPKNFLVVALRYVVLPQHCSRFVVVCYLLLDYFFFCHHCWEERTGEWGLGAACVSL